MPTAEGQIVWLEDERDPLAAAALALVHEAIGDVQPTADLLSEIEEARRGMPSGGRYRFLVQVDGGGAPLAVAAGMYLEAVNACFVTYLAVHPQHRRRRLGRLLRERLIEGFRDEARRHSGGELAWVVGEVRSASPWLRSLVGAGRAVAFHLPYFHPWMPRRAEGRYILYRQPVGDARREIPADEVARLLYAIWRRAYRIRYPLQSDTFCYMLDAVERAGTVGVHPDFPLPGDGPAG